MMVVYNLQTLCYYSSWYLPAIEASLCFEDLKHLNLVHPWTDDGCPVKGCCYKCPGGDSQRCVLRRTAREEGSGGCTEKKLFKRSL